MILHDIYLYLVNFIVIVFLVNTVYRKLTGFFAQTLGALSKGSLWGFMKGTTRILGDIDSPAIPADDWDIVSNPDRVLDPRSVPSP